MTRRGRHKPGHAVIARALPVMPLLSTLALLVATLFSPACAIGSQHFGRTIDLGDVARIRIGESTKQDVLDLFGPPTYYSRGADTQPSAPARRPDGRIERGSDGDDIFTYEYREEGERFFTVLLFTRFSRESVADTLMVFFDARDVVQYVAFAQQTGSAADPDERR